MARNRAWRRAQRSRIIKRRRQFAMDTWAYSWANWPDWVEKQAMTWSKINPFTVCSCAMCRNRDWRPAIDWRRDWNV